MSDDLVKQLAEIAEDYENGCKRSGAEVSNAIRSAIARIAHLEAELANGSFYKESDIDRLMSRADAAEAKLREAVEIAKSIVRDWESTEEDQWPGGAEEECSSYASRASRIARLTGEEQE